MSKIKFISLKFSLRKKNSKSLIAGSPDHLHTAAPVVSRPQNVLNNASIASMNRAPMDNIASMNRAPMDNNSHIKS